MSAPTRARTSPTLLDVLRHIEQGHTNAKIAREFGLSEDSIKRKCRALFADLGARDRAHAVAIGYQQGILGKSCACKAST